MLHLQRSRRGDEEEPAINILQACKNLPWCKVGFFIFPRKRACLLVGGTYKAVGAPGDIWGRCFIFSLWNIVWAFPKTLFVATDGGLCTPIFGLICVSRVPFGSGMAERLHQDTPPGDWGHKVHLQSTGGLWSWWSWVWLEAYLQDGEERASHVPKWLLSLGHTPGLLTPSSVLRCSTVPPWGRCGIL